MAEQEKPRIVIVEFFTEYKRKDSETVEEHWVTYAPAHSVQSTQTTEAVHRLKPSDKLERNNNSVKAAHVNFVWEQIEPHYNAWLKNEEVPEQGSPLDMFTSINAASRKVFKSNGIRTIEDLAAMTDTQCDKVQLPNVRNTRKLAKKFLEGLVHADAAERELQRDAEMEAMREKMAAMEALLEEKADQENGISQDVAQLRAECDALGVKYHHKAGVAKLRELIDEHRANEAA